MSKHIAIALILLTIGILAIFQFCSLNESVYTWENIPALWGQFAIDPVSNEVLLKKKYPDLEHSGCGLADDAFIKYAMSKVNYSRQFQFIVFTEGKPLVGDRCLRTALIFYLK